MLSRKIFYVLTCTLLFAQNRPQLGLALSGGGARGLAQIGVLQAFEENHIPIDVIAGTSAGAVIGGLYAAGVSLNEFKDWEAEDLLGKAVANKMDPRDIPLERRFQNLPSQFELYFNRNRFQKPKALLSDVGLHKLLTFGLAPGDFVADGDFDRLPIRFRAISSELIHQKVKVLNSGSLTEAVRKSMAFPIIYEPIIEDSSLYVDGGIYDNLPIAAARAAGADYIVAVNVATPSPRYAELNDLPALAAYYMNVFAARSDSNSVSGWDTFINIPLSNINLLDFQKGSEAIAAGYQAALKVIPQIKREFPYTSNPELFHMKQTMVRHALDDCRISKIEITGNHLLTKKQIRTRLPFKVGDSLHFNNDLKAIYSLLSNSFISSIQVRFSPDSTRQDAIAHIHVVENLKLRLTGGFYFDRSAGMNIYGSVENRRIFQTALYSQVNVYLGNFHSGVTLGLSLPQMLRFDLYDQRLGLQLMSGTHVYQYDSRFSGIDFLTFTTSQLHLQALSVLNGAVLLATEVAVRDFKYAVPGGEGFKEHLLDIPVWAAAGRKLVLDGDYFRYQFRLSINKHDNEVPILQGLTVNLSLTGGITQDNLANLKLLASPLRDVIFNRIEVNGAVGGFLTNRFGSSFSVSLARMLGDPMVAPLPEWVRPLEGSLQKYSLNADALMLDQVTMGVDLVYNPGIRSTWIHLNFFQSIGNHYPFENLGNLEPRYNVGIELSFEYDTPIGPLVYGFSWVEQSGWTGQSYARIGWIF